MHGLNALGFEWDPGKAAGNLHKHAVRFAEAVTVFEDHAMLTMLDDNPEEERFVAIGMGSLGRILVVIYATRQGAHQNHFRPQGHAQRAGAV